MTEIGEALNPRETRRADDLFREHQRKTHGHTDRLFAFLMMLQWLAGIVAALVISPRTWSGAMSSVHIHVWTAVGIGGAIAALPIALALLRPGRSSTRYVIATAQMLTSALLIHLTGGRIETHFHVFGSLAFLAFYRDWRVFIPATLVIATDHMVRGAFWPESVFGVLSASHWRWVEHAAWVIFEDIFLMRSCLLGEREMKHIALRRAQLESTNEVIAAKVDEQTKEIREREELFRSLTASSPVGILRTGDDPGTFVFANERCAAITGLPPGLITTKGFWDSIQLEDRDRVLESWALATSQKREFSQEFRIAQPGEQPRWLHMRGSCISGADGGYVATLQDITPEKTAALREASLHRILDDSFNEIYIIDADSWLFLEVNQGGRRNLGFTKQELTGMTPLDLQPEFDTASFRELIAPLRNGDRESLVFETFHLRKDGSTYPIEVRVQRSCLGEKDVLVSVVVDVTERKRADKERARLTTAIEQAAEAMLITELDGTVCYVNPSFERITGYSSKEVVGSDPSFLNTGEHEDAFHPDLWAKAFLGPWSGSFTNRRKDGTVFEAEATVSAIRDEKGDITNFVCIQRDVTQQKLLESQLSHSQKLEAIGQLAAGIAHEINTPTQYVGDNTRFIADAFNDLLPPMQQLSKLLDNEGAASPSSEDLDVIRKALDEADIEYLTEEIPRAVEQSLEGIQRVTRIVRAMKEFSHPAEDKTPTDLNRAIESTITVARNEWKYVADLETDFDPGLGQVSCVPGDFNQVILNMIVNASHAIADVVGDGHAGKGTIRVTTKDDGDWAEIRIADTGTGIPEDLRRKIFDPFFTTKEVGKGTGQGLSIAHSIVTVKHAGELKVESEPGKGTTFIIRLPKQAAAVEEAEEVHA